MQILIIFSGYDEFYTANFSNPASYSKMNMSATTVIIVHGFLGTCYNGWPIELMNVLSLLEIMNVICIDWSKWAKYNYVPDAQNYVYRVAQFLADLVRFLRDKLGIPLSNLILIGHSFGGIIIGCAGKQFKDPQMPLAIGK